MRPRKTTEGPWAERLPPYSEATEQAILGAILLDGSAITECITKIKKSEQSFYDLRHQLIYRTMLELYDDNVPIDLVNIHERMNLFGTLQQVGGDAYIGSLPERCASVHNLDSYISTLTSKYLARTTIALCTETIQQAYEVNGNGAEFITQFEDKCLHVRRDTETMQSFISVSEQRQRLVADYEAAHSNTAPVGLLTGFAALDAICGGMKGPEMIVLAGMQSTGKTTLALNIASNICAAGGSVGIISLETSGKKIVHRMACNLGRVEGSNMLKGQFTDEMVGKMSTAFSRMVGFGDRLIISDTGGMDSKSVGALARRMHQRGAQIIIIDYLQLIESYARSEFERVTKVSRDIKSLSKFLNIPVIVLSSFNREALKGKPRPPILQDLRMSGQIEYDAEKAWLLYDPEFNQEYNPTAFCRPVALRVAKHKDGPLGTVNLAFFPQQFRMSMGTHHNQEEPEPQPQGAMPYADA